MISVKKENEIDVFTDGSSIKYEYNNVKSNITGCGIYFPNKEFNDESITVPE